MPPNCRSSLIPFSCRIGYARRQFSLFLDYLHAPFPTSPLARSMRSFFPKLPLVGGLNRTPVDCPVLGGQQCQILRHRIRGSDIIRVEGAIVPETHYLLLTARNLKNCLCFQKSDIASTVLLRRSIQRICACVEPQACCPSSAAYRRLKGANR